MAKEDIAPYQRNLEFKHSFKLLGLDLAEVIEFTPFSLDLENSRLEDLLDFVYRYKQSGSREVMELNEGGFLFPPIFPGISPDSDWYRFELWMQGQPIRKKLLEQLPITFELKNLAELTDEEIHTTLEELESAMLGAGYGICLHEGVPPRLVYAYIADTLGETFELDPGEGWHLDGCSGYCPGCFQRPWCDTGDSSCWPEDEKAGKMSLIDSLIPYVSASPPSLAILQRLQAEEDERFAKFKEENPDSDFGCGDEWKVRMN